MSNVHTISRNNQPVQVPLHAEIQVVEKALARNPLCTTGLLVQQRVFATATGPSKGPELLALIYADDPIVRYWYAHIMRHPNKSGTYVALLVWSEVLVNASTVPLLFARYHYWMKDRLQYHPCAVQDPFDAYDEQPNMLCAAQSLARMITRFDLGKRWPEENSPYEESPPELRIFDIYGLNDSADEHGCYPPPPMLKGIAALKNYP